MILISFSQSLLVWIFNEALVFGCKTGHDGIVCLGHGLLLELCTFTLWEDRLVDGEA